MSTEIIIGIDEVGRGAIAGPITVCALLLRAETAIPNGLKDSKKLTKKNRERIHQYIIEQQMPVFVKSVTPQEVDILNSHHASLEAMRRAANEALGWMHINLPEDFKSKNFSIKIDGPFKIPNIEAPQVAIPGGDSTEDAIMLAATFAKVERDSYMLELSKIYPNYCWDKNSGYCVNSHLLALKEHGPTEHHRRTYRPVYAATTQATEEDALFEI